VNSDSFANRATRADLARAFRVLIGVILRQIANHRMRMNPASRPNFSVSENHHRRADTAAAADSNRSVDDGVRANHGRRVDFRSRINDGCRMDGQRAPRDDVRNPRTGCTKSSYMEPRSSSGRVPLAANSLRLAREGANPPGLRVFCQLTCRYAADPSLAVPVAPNSGLSAAQRGRRIDVSGAYPARGLQRSLRTLYPRWQPGRTSQHPWHRGSRTA
jgi:hypothetical protein